GRNGGRGRDAHAQAQDRDEERRRAGRDLEAGRDQVQDRLAAHLRRRAGDGEPLRERLAERHPGQPDGHAPRVPGRRHGEPGPRRDRQDGRPRRRGGELPLQDRRRPGRRPDVCGDEGRPAQRQGPARSGSARRREQARRQLRHEVPGRARPDRQPDAEDAVRDAQLEPGERGRRRARLVARAPAEPEVVRQPRLDRDADHDAPRRAQPAPGTAPLRIPWRLVMTDSQNGAREPVRVYFTGTCEGLEKLREALSNHPELEVVGASEQVSQASSVLAPKGGTGKTSIATNLAASLAKHSGKRTLLLDLDLQFGDAAIMLGLEPEKTIYDLVVAPGELDSEKLAGYITRHPCGLEILPAPLRPEDAELVTEAKLGRLLEVARDSYDVIVVDTSPFFHGPMLATLDRTDELLMLCGLDVPTLKNVRLSLQTLDLLSFPTARIRFVLNRANSKVGM